jgi:hypothetical protein
VPDRVQLRKRISGEVQDFAFVDAKENLRGKSSEWMPFQAIPPRQISGPTLKRNSDLALVIGTGPSMESEVAGLTLADFDIFCVNGAVLKYKCDHFATWHFEGLWKWKRDCPFIPFPLVHSRERQPGVNVVWDWSAIRGSSSLNTVMSATSMGYKTVVVAGVALTEHCEQYRHGWTDHEWWLQGKLLSAGGWLAEIFGKWREQ